VRTLGAIIHRSRRRRFRLLYEKRIACLRFWRRCRASPSAPSLIWTHDWSRDTKISLTVLELFLWLVLTLALLDQIVRPLQTLTNVVGALREEDYSFRARGAAPNDSMGELALEINSLADILTEQRVQTIEATALLRRVVEEIDTPLFTFDPDHVLRLMNAAGERLLQQPAARLLGKTASELELNACFEAPNETLVALPYSAPNARWMVRKRSFRQNGVPHTLIVLSDVSRALREEERSAWQKLIRVLGHELNNSLAPIISIAGSLASRLPLEELPEAQNADFQRGLNIIESRTAALHRFLQSYRKLAQMPAPTLQPIELRPLFERVAALETRVKVDISPGAELVLMMDPDLIEQMLINLVRNAVDAALEQARRPRIDSEHPSRPDTRAPGKLASDARPSVASGSGGARTFAQRRFVRENSIACRRGVVQWPRDEFRFLRTCECFCPSTAARPSVPSALQCDLCARTAGRYR
jgi:two-component system, NtrC family, nitrogen regulation sensor histidine kinase NtrY